eukprot:scaffold2.g7154.t1
MELCASRRALRARQRRDLVLELEAGEDRDRAAIDLLLTTAKVVQKERLGCDILVTGAGGAGACAAGSGSRGGGGLRQLLLLQVDLYFPNELLQGAYPWRRSRDAAALFAHMAPLLPGGGEGPSYAEGMARAAEAWEPKPGSGDPYTVASCLLSLPVRMTEEPLPPLMTARPASSAGLSLAHLDTTELRRVLHACDPATLKAAASTCRHLRLLAADVPPGLKLALHRHQRAALRWMLGREGPPQELPHPCWAQFTTAGGDGTPFWGNVATGELSAEPPPPVRDFRGGLLCDDPGLGKTVSMIALVCRTAGLLPAPPPGKEVQWADAERRRGTYLLSAAEAATATQLRRSASAAVAGGAAGDAGGGGGGGRRSLRASSRRGSRSSVSFSSSVLDAKPATTEGSVQGGDGSGDEGTSGGSIGATDMPQPKRRRLRAQPEQQGGRASGVDGMGGGAGAQALAAQMPAAPASAGAGADDAAQNGVEVGGETYVQCDLCHKWRCIPPELAAQALPLPEGAWSCAMHPDPERAAEGCRAEQEDEDEGLVLSSCAGWVGEGEAAASPANVAHFRRLIKELQERPPEGSDANPWRSAGEEVLARSSVLRWLAKRAPAELAKPFAVPSSSRYPKGFGQLLARVGFQPTTQEQERRARRRQQGRRSGGVGAGGGEAAGGGDVWDAGSWERKARFALLLPDTPALAAALAAGPEEVQYRVYVSKTTLIVVPSVLIPHWLDQINRHVQRHTLAVHVFQRGGEILGYPQALPREELLQKLAWECDVCLTSIETFSHSVDPRRPMASPLMQARVRAAALRRRRRVARSTMALLAERRWVMTGTPTPSRTGSEAVQARAARGRAAHGEGRGCGAGVHAAPYLWSLLAFLHQQPYGTQQHVWQEAVAAPFAARQPAGRQRLMQVLAHCMIRASKQELWGLPALVRKVTLLHFAKEHAASWNAFVDIVRFNLLTSDWMDPDHRESLLSDANRDRARQTLNNLRLSCNVSGNCTLQARAAPPPGPPGPARLAALGPPARRFPASSPAAPPAGALSPPYLEEGHSLERVQRAMMWGGACDVCAVRRRVTLFTPCAHVLCTDCAAGEVFPFVCWRGRRKGGPWGGPVVSAQALKRCRRIGGPRRARWDVPQQVIEWQPAFAQKGAKGKAEGEWQPDWQHTKSTKCLHLLQRLREIGAAPPRPGAAGSSGGGGAGGGGAASPGAAAAATAGGAWPGGRSTDLAQPLQQMQALGGLGVLPVTERGGTHMDLLQLYLTRHLGWQPAVIRQHMSQADKAEQLHRFKYDPGCSVLLMDESGAVGHDLSMCHHVFLMEPIADKSIEDQARPGEAALGEAALEEGGGGFSRAEGAPGEGPADAKGRSPAGGRGSRGGGGRTAALAPRARPPHRDPRAPPPPPPPHTHTLQVVSRAHRMGVTQDVTVELLAMRGTLEEHMLAQMQREGRWGAAAAASPAAGDGTATSAAAAGADDAAGAAARGDGRAGRGAAAKEAAERETRNALLLSLRPVPAAEQVDASFSSDDEEEEGWLGRVGVASLLPQLLATAAAAGAQDAAEAEAEGDEDLEGGGAEPGAPVESAREGAAQQEAGQQEQVQRAGGQREAGAWQEAERQHQRQGGAEGGGAAAQLRAQRPRVRWADEG